MIVKEIKEVPEPLLQEILDFIKFLKKTGSRRKLSTAIASESSLAKDWNRKEEDAAWRDL